VLSEVEKREIEEEIAHSHGRRAACIGALKIVQAHRGYVSDEAIQDLAPFREITPDELEGVATFYSLIFRHPVGRHVLKVCDSVVCWSLGSESLLQHLEQRLEVKAGGTTPDGRFTLLRICCLGDCDYAPVMMVDDRQVRNVTPAMLDQILQNPEAVEE